MFRQQITRQVRLFSTTPIARKSPVETIKDAAKVVDKTISGAAVKGIEKGGTYTIPPASNAITWSPSPCTLASNTAQSHGPCIAYWLSKTEQAAEAVKQAVPESTGEAKGQANEVAGQAKGKANELAGEAKGKAAELQGEANKKM
jgi:isoleucyl-tRNA synthetase